jgi:hypothetical protein
MDRSNTGDRFTVHGGNVWDDDFHYDALLEISGDFPSHEDRVAYAQAVAAALNAAQIPDGKS